jgi:hypothetical protein
VLKLVQKVVVNSPSEIAFSRLSESLQKQGYKLKRRVPYSYISAQIEFGLYADFKIRKEEGERSVITISMNSIPLYILATLLTIMFFAIVIWLRLTLFAALIGFSCGMAFLRIYQNTHKKEEKIKAAIHKERVIIALYIIKHFQDFIPRA